VLQSKSSTAPAAPEARAEATRKHLRGSNLLLVGRLISLATNFLVGVLTVRYLSKSDYGAFSYALQIGTTGANVVLLGMPRAVSRFAPMYQERRDYGAMYGSMALAIGVIGVLGLLAVGLGVLLREPVLTRFVGDPLSLSLLVILIALAPLQALDSLFQSLLAVFAGPAAIFFRRYVLGPLLRLGAIGLVWALHGSVYFLAWAYLAAAVLGVAVYGPMMKRSLHKLGLLQHLSWHGLRFPWRDLLGFGLPLVVADVMAANRATLLVVLLGYVSDPSQVADYTAFLKISGLNMIVLQSMKLLFLPVASRMFAREDHAGIDDLYWKTTIWISIVTFPIFVPCLTMADSMALVINGPQYVASSGVLAALAVGEYFNAAMGLNTYTLQVYARVRFLVWTTVVATLGGFACALLLVPSQGAMGAAIATSVALVLQNLLHHWGLHKLTKIELVRWPYLRVYASQLVALGLFLALEHALHPPLWLEVPLVCAATLALLRMHRATMDLGNVFPELKKLPFLGRFLFTH